MVKLNLPCGHRRGWRRVAVRGGADRGDGALVYVVSGLRSPWATAWPSFRDYS